jgi:hypothetical protein
MCYKNHPALFFSRLFLCLFRLVCLSRHSILATADVFRGLSFSVFSVYSVVIKFSCGFAAPSNNFISLTVICLYDNLE